MIKEIELHQKDLQAILEFVQKYMKEDDNDLVTITVESGSGIGSTVKASIPAFIQGDNIMMVKTISGVESW